MVSVAYTPPNPLAQIAGGIGTGYMQQQNLQQQMSQNQRRLDIMEKDVAARQSETDRRKSQDWQANVTKIMQSTDPGAQRNLALYQLSWRDKYPLQGTLPDGTSYDYINEPRWMTQEQKIAVDKEAREKKKFQAERYSTYKSEVDEYIGRSESMYDEYMASVIGSPRYIKGEGTIGTTVLTDAWLDKENLPKDSVLIDYDKQQWIVTKEQKKYADSLGDYFQMLTSLSSKLKGLEFWKTELFPDIVNYIQPGDIEWTAGMSTRPLLSKIRGIIKRKKAGDLPITEVKPPGGANLVGQSLQGSMTPSIPPEIMTGQPAGPTAPPPMQQIQQRAMPPSARTGPPSGQPPPPQQQVPPWFGQLSPDDQLAVLEAVTQGQPWQEIEAKLRAGGLIR